MTAAVTFTLTRPSMSYHDKVCVEVKVEMVCTGTHSYDESEAVQTALAAIHKTFNALVVKPSKEPPP